MTMTAAVAAAAAAATTPTTTTAVAAAATIIVQACDTMSRRVRWMRQHVKHASRTHVCECMSVCVLRDYVNVRPTN